MFLDKFILVEVSVIFFDIGFFIVGFIAFLEFFFELKIMDIFFEVDEFIMDYVLVIWVVFFIYLFCVLLLKVWDFYVDNFWFVFVTVKAMTEKKWLFKRIIIKFVLFGL